MGSEVAEDLVPLREKPPLKHIQSAGCQRIKVSGANRVVLNQSGAFQHFQVLADGRSTDRKQFGSGVECLHDLPTRRIAKSIEGCVG
jgi:hypothetical protein